MGNYADVYGRDGVKMCDGTFKLSQHDGVVVLWTVPDCLLRSKIVGWTACFTENADSIIEGAKLFFPNEIGTSIKSC